MLEGFLGADVFKKGVNIYLNKFKYDNAETKDLWAALTQAAEESGQTVNVSRVMDTWTLQMGLPVVEVNYNGETGLATLRQKRFFGSQGAEKKAASVKDVSSPFAYVCNYK
jgi:aminopeptidase N